MSGKKKLPRYVVREGFQRLADLVESERAKAVEQYKTALSEHIWTTADSLKSAGETEASAALRNLWIDVRDDNFGKK